MDQKHERAKAAISYFVQERERIKREKRIELILAVITLLAIFIGLPIVACGIAILIG